MAKLLSHENLGISFAEWGALIATRTMIACGALAYRDKNRRWDRDRGHFINMEIPCKKNEHCGTIGCIGGNMALIMGHTHPAHYVSTSNGELKNLFYPNRYNSEGYYVDYNDINPTQMLAAIDSYLTTGTPNWKVALNA